MPRIDGAGPVAVARELARLLSGTEAARADSRDRICSLAANVDWKVLARNLHDQRLLALIGTRVEAACPGAAPAGFREAVADEVQRARLWSLTHRYALSQVHEALAAARVPVVSLKGVGLAEALYGDAGLRPTSDIDVLTSTSHLRRAAEALREAGWERPVDPPRVGGLPELHYCLPHASGILPAVEVHWRLHWYERRSAATLLAAGTRDEGGVGRLAREHELAALLLFYARDGMIGLRWPADIAAWWDRYGEDLPEDGIGPFARAHPELTGALVAGALAAERLVGVPAERVLPRSSRHRRSRLAARLANWRRDGDERQRAGDLTLSDLLLTPPGGGREFVRRHLLPPCAAIAQTYDVPPGHPLRLRARRWWHGRAMTVTYLRAWLRALLRVARPEGPPGDGRVPFLLAVHSAQRGGAEIMALAEAQRLERSFAPVIAIPDGPLRDSFAGAGEVIPGAPSVPLWGAGPRRWLPALVRTLFTAVRLAAVVRRRRLAFVLTNSSVLLAPVIAARLARVPAIVHVRDVPASRLARTVFAIHGALADLVVVVSERLEAELPRPRRARVVRIPDGVPVPAGSAPAPGFGAPLRLTVVGGLDPRKGQDVAVEALARLRGHGLDARLELVGRDVDPSFGERLRERSRELGLAERVDFCGERTGADAALADADIVLAPSRDEWTPLVVMEALARGKPVIASSVGGMVELVADGRTGILVAPDDSDGLAREVLRLAASPGSAREMASNGRRDVAARFSIERCLDALEAELRRALDAA